MSKHDQVRQARAAGREAGEALAHGNTRRYFMIEQATLAPLDTGTPRSFDECAAIERAFFDGVDERKDGNR